MGKRFLTRATYPVSVGPQSTDSNHPSSASYPFFRVKTAQTISRCYRGGHMDSPSSRLVLGGMRAALLVLLAICLAPLTWAQHGSEGTVTVTVVDPSGSVVQGAQLELRDAATNDVRKAETQA